MNGKDFKHIFHILKNFVNWMVNKLSSRALFFSLAPFKHISLGSYHPTPSNNVSLRIAKTGLIAVSFVTLYMIFITEWTQDSAIVSKALLFKKQESFSGCFCKNFMFPPLNYYIRILQDDPRIFSFNKFLLTFLHSHRDLTIYSWVPTALDVGDINCIAIIVYRT